MKIINGVTEDAQNALDLAALAGAGHTNETVKGNADNIATLTTAQAQLSNQVVDIAEANAEAEIVLARNGQTLLGSNLLLMDDIKGTTQSITYNTDGTVGKIVHKDSENATVREDVYTYATNLVTEVRTLTAGGTIAYKYHLDTLETEVI